MPDGFIRCPSTSSAVTGRALSVADPALPDLHHALKPLQRGQKMLLWLDHLSSLCHMFKNQNTLRNVS